MSGKRQSDNERLAHPATAPRLVTDRLILRAMQREDFDAFCATRAKPDVMRHIASEPFSRAELWGKFLRGPGMWPLLGYGIWSVERRADGRLIGEIGLADFQRDIDPALPGAARDSADYARFATWPEAAWLLDSDVHGQGYAGEALAAILDWADAQLHVPLVCMIAPANAPSLKLAARHGFEVVSHRLHQDAPVLVLQRDLTVAKQP